MPAYRYSDEFKCTSGMGYGLRDFCQEIGADFSSAAARVGLATEVFEPPFQPVSLDRFSHLLEILAEETQDDTFGLQFAQTSRVGDTGLLGLALYNSPTLRLAEELFLRCGGLITNHTQYSIEFGEQTVVRAWTYNPYLAQRDQYKDMGVYYAIRMMRRYAGQNWYPTSCALERETPKNLPLYYRTICPRIAFSQPYNRLIYDADYLSSTSAEADTRIYFGAKAQCEAAAAELAIDRNIVERTRSTILMSLGRGAVSMPCVAHHLGLTPRGLQRRLAEHGATFEDVLDGARRRLAEHLLTRPETQICEVARKCGYASTSTFSRAAKAWFGVRPTAYRKAAGRL